MHMLRAAGASRNGDAASSRHNCGDLSQADDAVHVGRSLEHDAAGRHVRRQDGRQPGRLGLPVPRQEADAQRHGEYTAPIRRVAYATH